jgi:c-di-GMP-binding flagellar brake protein YcgR
MAGATPPRISDELLKAYSRRSAELEDTASAEYAASAEQVVTLLKRVKEHNFLVTVMLPGSAQCFSSAILAIHPTENYLVLDELIPADGNARLRDAETVYVHARLNGVDLSFATKPGTSGREAGVAFYRLPLPERMIYWQRRAAYRVVVGGELAIPATLTKVQGMRLDGELVDLSLSGTAIHFVLALGRSLQLALAASDVPHYCSISFPDGLSVTSELKVHHVTYDQAIQTLRVGGSFVGLDPAQSKIIAQFVISEDRRQTRDRSG